MLHKRLIQVQVLSCLIVPTEYWNGDRANQELQNMLKRGLKYAALW